MDKYQPQLEERADGMYLTVWGAFSKPAQLDELRTNFDAQCVTNLEWGKVEEVFRRGKGVPEFIGPKFVRYDLRKNEILTFRTSPFEAAMKLGSRAEKELEITQRDVEYRLTRLGIRHGLLWEAVRDTLKRKLTDEWQVVARCTPAVPGKDARIEEKVEVEGDTRPLRLPDGTVDFRSLQVFRQIQEGEVIAVKHPPGRGMPGVDIFGQPIAAVDGLDAELPAGKGTQVSPDGKFLMAGASGFLFRQDGKIGIEEVLLIRSDVDYKTGNISYPGNIHIQGHVLDGFRVEAGGDILIEGEVEAAEIVSKNGSVRVRRGVFGKGRGLVHAHGQIGVGVGQEAAFECDGAFTVQKSLRNCKVRVGSMNSPEGCDLQGNECTAYEGIDVHGTGFDGPQNTFHLLDREQEAVKEKLAELERLQQGLQEGAAPVEARIRELNQMKKAATGGELHPHFREELKHAMNKFYAGRMKIRYLEDRKKKLLETLQARTVLPGNILLHGNIAKGTHLDLYGVHHEFLAPSADKKVIWTTHGLGFEKLEEPPPKEE